MRKSLRSILGAGAFAVASLLPMKQTEAQGNVSGSVEYIQSMQKDGNSYARLNGFYTLPKGISGFTFTELYKDGKGFYGETALDKEIKNGLGIKLRAFHANEPLTKAGIGVTQSIPHLPKNAFAQVGFIPVWVGNKGKTVGDNAVTQYFASVDLPHGFRVSSFAEWELLGKDGVQFGYGEINVDKKINSNLTIGYNPVLINKGNAVPRLEHRVVGRIGFGAKK